MNQSLTIRRRTLGFALALALGASVSNAHAANISIDISSGQASFDSLAPLLGGGDDVLTFTGLAQGTYDYVFSLSAQFISGLSGTVNGTSFATASLGPITAGAAFGTADGPFTVVLSGTPTSGRAIYSGELTVTPAGTSNAPAANPASTSPLARPVSTAARHRSRAATTYSRSRVWRRALTTPCSA